MSRRPSYVLSSATGGGTPGTAEVRFEPTVTFPVGVSTAGSIGQIASQIDTQLAIMLNLDTLQMPIDPNSVNIQTIADIVLAPINVGVAIVPNLDLFILSDQELLVAVAPSLESIAMPVDVQNSITITPLIDALNLDTSNSVVLANSVDQITLGDITQSVGISQALTGIWDYTVPGTYTWVSPITGTILVQMTGAGGGGNSNKITQGSGGGAGGAGVQTNAYAVTAGNSYQVVVGAGGAFTNPGTAGGDSSFDTTGVVAKGGGGGGPGSAGAQGTGGVAPAASASTGDVKHVGGNGGGGGGIQPNGGGGGGSGGVSGDGGAGASNRTAGTAGAGGGAVGGTGAQAATTAATVGGTYGGGGGGAAASANGADGGPGRVRLTVFLV